MPSLTDTKPKIVTIKTRELIFREPTHKCVSIDSNSRIMGKLAFTNCMTSLEETTVNFLSRPEQRASDVTTFDTKNPCVT